MCAQPYTSPINASTTWPRAAFASSYVITGRMRSTSRVRELLSEPHRRYMPHRRIADYMIAISERYLRPVCVERDTEAVSSMTSPTIHNSANWKRHSVSREISSFLLFLCRKELMENYRYTYARLRNNHHGRINSVVRNDQLSNSLALPVSLLQQIILDSRKK